MKYITIFEFNKVVLIALVLVIAGCGFQLRGLVELPVLYERVYLVDKGYSDIAVPLKRSLNDSNSTIVDSKMSATSVITLLSRGVQRRALNISGREVREYELQLDVAFVVQDDQGVQLADKQTVSVVRNFENDESNTLGKNNEEQVIRQEMNEAAVIQILYRLKAIAK